MGRNHHKHVWTVLTRDNIVQTGLPRIPAPPFTISLFFGVPLILSFEKIRISPPKIFQFFCRWPSEYGLQNVLRLSFLSRSPKAPFPHWVHQERTPPLPTICEPLGWWLYCFCLFWGQRREDDVFQHFVREHAISVPRQQSDVGII